jgi:hypothetical protein
MKSIAGGTGCPDAFPLMIAGVFAATLKRRYAEPPP